MKEENNPQKRLTRRERALLERKRTCRLLGALLAVAIVVAGIGNLAGKDKEFSENENRMLAQKPQVTWEGVKDGSLFRDFENYLADQFVGRDQWTALDFQEHRLMGQKESSGVYLCKDDYLMEEPTTPDSDSVQRNVKAIKSFFERYSDVKMHMMVVPNAVTILKDYLPNHAPVRDQMKDWKKVKKKLPKSLDVIDVSKALTKHKNEGVFYRTDHHWTSLGAYYAFQAAAQSLGIKTDELKQYKAHTVSNTFEGTLASKSGCHEVTDTITVYEPQEDDTQFYVTYDDTQEKSRSLFVEKCLEDKDQYTVFFGGNHPRVTIRTTSESGRRLLIFKDSYANSFIQFLTPYYEKIILVDPRYYYDNASSIISGEKITDVLFLYNLNTYLEDNSLADTLDAAQPEQTAEGDTDTTGTGQT